MHVCKKYPFICSYAILYLLSCKLNKFMIIVCCTFDMLSVEKEIKEPIIY